jgi:hypothetical protein
MPTANHRPDRANPRLLACALLLATSAFAACGGSPAPGGAPDGGGSPDGGAPDAGDGGSPGGDGGCLGSGLLTALGKSSLLVGAQMEDATAAAASFDVRYLYLSGGLFDGATPCNSCTTSCTSDGTSCGTGCGWWGCWQDPTKPPGGYALAHIQASKANQQVPMFTYYQMLAASGWSEGAPEVDAANDAAKLTRLFNDYRFLLQKIGSETALLHLEPDLWGYAQQKNGNPDLIPAKVKAANPTDCSALADTWSGFGRCLIAMTRKYAPNAKVGLHGSSWATNIDVTINKNASLDVAGEAGKLAAFLAKCGGADADFVAVDASDRDADFYRLVLGQDQWWDATNQTLPSFHQAFAWAKALGEGLGRPVIFWQVPLGNAAQGNTKNHYKDNRVDYFFAHPDELAAAHVAGMFFGAGESRQTTPESDGGNLVSRVKAWRAAGSTPLCK